MNTIKNILAKFKIKSKQIKRINFKSIYLYPICAFFIIIFLSLKKIRILRKKCNIKEKFLLNRRLGFIRLIKSSHIKINRSSKSVKLNKIQEYIRTHSPSLPCGLKNFSQNCFINCLFQSFSSLNVFLKFLIDVIEKTNIANLENNQKKDFEIIQELSENLNEINESRKSYLSNRGLIDFINEKFSFENEQQDSYELYHRIVELVDDFLLLMNENLRKKIQNPFKITYDTFLKCEVCHSLLTRVDSNLDLTLVPRTNHLNLHSLIKINSAPIYIDDYVCNYCSILSVLKQIELKFNYLSNFKILSDYLRNLLDNEINSFDLTQVIEKIVSFSKEKCIDSCLKELKFTPISNRLSKFSKIKIFPDILCINIQKVFFDESAFTSEKKVLISDSLYFDKNKGIITNLDDTCEKVEYAVISIVEHFGNHDNGHYIAYRKFYNSWLIINDTSVEFIKNQYKNNINPYLVFYRKMN